MTTRRVITFLLGAFVVVSLAWTLTRPWRERQGTPLSSASSAPLSGELNGYPIPGVTLAPSTRLVAMYFHGTTRCATCFAIETHTREALTAHFSAELANKTLLWVPINIDAPENKRFLSHYKLYVKSLVIASVRDGVQRRWKNLDGVWDHVDNPLAFQSYVGAEVKAFLDSTED